MCHSPQKCSLIPRFLPESLVTRKTGGGIYLTRACVSQKNGDEAGGKPMTRAACHCLEWACTHCPGLRVLWLGRAQQRHAAAHKHPSQKLCLLKNGHQQTSDSSSNTPGRLRRPTVVLDAQTTLPLLPTQPSARVSSQCQGSLFSHGQL